MVAVFHRLAYPTGIDEASSTQSGTGPHLMKKCKFDVDEINIQFFGLAVVVEQEALKM